MSNYEDFNGNFNNGKNIFAVVHFNNGKEKEALALLTKRSLEWLQGPFLAFILHDKDTDNEQEKIPHIHIVLESAKAQSKQNWITEIAETFGLVREAVGVKALGSRRGAVRYLTHCDFPEKHQYDKSEVISPYTSEVEKCFAAVKTREPSFDELMACNTRKDIYDLVGMSGYQKAKNAWEDLNAETAKNDYWSAKYERLLDSLYRVIYDPSAMMRGIVQIKAITSLLTDEEKQEFERRFAIDRHNSTAFKATQKEDKKHE